MVVLVCGWFLGRDGLGLRFETCLQWLPLPYSLSLMSLSVSSSVGHVQACTGGSSASFVDSFHDCDEFG